MGEKQVSGLVKDPVCGMDVDPARAAASYDYAGRTYFFCNPMCLEKFRADPEKYLAQPAPVAEKHAHSAPGNVTIGIGTGIGPAGSRPSAPHSPPPPPETGTQVYTCP